MRPRNKQLAYIKKTIQRASNRKQCAQKNGVLQSEPHFFVINVTTNIEQAFIFQHQPIIPPFRTQRCTFHTPGILCNCLAISTMPSLSAALASRKVYDEPDSPLSEKLTVLSVLLHGIVKTDKTDTS